ncbi:F-box domain-containing protein [Heracleum sosnowskyi]|uniref:F-box domain-containing protein n=1 Tax=Heracleum sosnowskyi TaxID=360622 RepID=A0AAD8M7N4_9APIA|nr:F-box domain-containing protein [Heracleum sosnowskyi]
MVRKKKVKIRREDNGGDIISQLPDEMIHKILSFSDARYSKKIPKNSNDECKFIDHVLSRRDDQSPIKKLKLSVVHRDSRWIIDWFRDYALSHKVESLQIDSVHHLVRHNLSSYDSQSLKQLKLAVSVKFGTPFEQDTWFLPALTTLDLTGLTSKEYKLPSSCLFCLFSLQTLHLNSFDLPQSFSLLSLKTLFLARCNLPQGPCKLPALLTLELHDVVYPANMTEFFSGLVSLQNLTLFFNQVLLKDCLINCPQLVNLKITNATTRPCGNIMIFSPKICNFTSVGIFSISFGLSQLENVYVKLWERTRCRAWKLKQYYCRFLSMFLAFGSAKILSFDSETIKALSTISDIVAQCGSPFSNLKYLKLPEGCEESIICGSIKSYLLNGSPRATIITKTPQVAEVAFSAAVGGDGDGQVRSSRGDGDTGLWQGHKVKSEFVGLLDLIMKKYPETFEYFTTNTESKLFCTMKLNMLCTSVDAFSKISTTEVDDKMVTEHKVVFAELQKLGFKVNWLESHLNCIERGISKSLLHD